MRTPELIRVHFVFTLKTHNFLVQMFEKTENYGKKRIIMGNIKMYYVKSLFCVSFAFISMI